MYKIVNTLLCVIYESCLESKPKSFYHKEIIFSISLTLYLYEMMNVH